MQNYKKDPEMENELNMIEIENYVRFWDNGQFEFKECEYCTGPLLGHIQSKCPRVEYDEKGVKRFKNHLKNLGGFDACLRRGYKKYKQEIEGWTQKEEKAPRTTEIKKTRQVPSWSGQKFEKWRHEIEMWNRSHTSSEEDKY